MMIDVIRQGLERDDQGIGRFLVASMIVGFLALTVAIVATMWVTARGADHTYWVTHSYKVEVAIGRLQTVIEKAETARRGYLLMPTLVDFRTTHGEAEADTTRALGEVAMLTRDNPVQQAQVARVGDVLRAIRTQRNLTNRLAATGRVEQGITAFRANIVGRRMSEIRTLLGEMLVEESSLLSQRDAERIANLRIFYATLVVTGLLLLAVALLSLTTVLRYTRDLSRSRASLQQLNETLEDAVTVRTADLTRANEEIQRFAYIVSHDLRSPLVNVMGFTAELESGTRALSDLVDRVETGAPALLDDDARNAARDDLPEAIGFIRTSTAKMDRLINAILKLSREGRRLLAPEPLDMDALVSAIRETLQHRLVESGGEIAVLTSLPAIVGDRTAVDQIFANVIENAVKYADPSRPVRVVVRGRAEGGRAVFEISDNGRGIAPRDHSRVFDLFRRAGAQDQPGEGIGLAHVRALTYRLGGSIEVESELGQGSTFRITLPLTYLEPTGTSA